MAIATLRIIKLIATATTCRMIGKASNVGLLSKMSYKDHYRGRLKKEQAEQKPKRTRGRPRKNP